MTVGSARTGLTRNPTLAARASTSSCDGGSLKATANTFPSNWSPMAANCWPTASGMAVRASGLGVMAARSTAGSWARWASAPTTTPGSARFRLIRTEASDCPVCRASSITGARLDSVS